VLKEQRPVDIVLAEAAVITLLASMNAKQARNAMLAENAKLHQQALAEELLLIQAEP